MSTAVDRSHDTALEEKLRQTKGSYDALYHFLINSEQKHLDMAHEIGAQTLVALAETIWGQMNDLHDIFHAKDLLLELANK